jgi:ABC-2 type transport system permease protein
MTAIAILTCRRFLRDRTNLFFVFVLPFMIILLVASSANSRDDSPLAVVGDSELIAAVTAQLDSTEIDVYATEDGALGAVRSDAAVGLLTSSDLDLLTLRTKPGRAADTRAEVEAAVSAINAQRSIEAAARANNVTSDQLEGALALEPADVETEHLTADEWGGLDTASATSMTQTVLFMFLAALTAASFLVEDRQLGTTTRLLATPTPPSHIVIGETLGRLLVTLLQAGLIMAVTWSLFGVGWGNPIVTVATITLFGLVATGCSVALGSLVNRTDATTAIGITAALTLAALGGAMAPVEVFPDTMQTIARAIPHFWAIEGLTTSMSGGTTTSAWRPVAVLAAMSVAVLTLATAIYRRRGLTP